MRSNEETGQWAEIAPVGELSDPELTPSIHDPRADAVMHLFETFVNRYQAQAFEMRRVRT